MQSEVYSETARTYLILASFTCAVNSLKQVINKKLNLDRQGGGAERYQMKECSLTRYFLSEHVVLANPPPPPVTPINTIIRRRTV